MAEGKISEAVIPGENFARSAKRAHRAFPTNRRMLPAQQSAANRLTQRTNERPARFINVCVIDVLASLFVSPF
jgi:hypothetical protein